MVPLFPGDNSIAKREGGEKTPLFSAYSAPFASVGEDFSRIIVHGVESLIPQVKDGEPLSRLERSSGKPVLILYPTPLSYDELKNVFEKIEPSKSFSHIFTLSPRFLPFVESLSNWSWLPFPVALGPKTTGEEWETAKPPLKVVYAPLRASLSEAKAIQQAVDSIPRSADRVKLEVLDLKKLASISELRSSILGADFVIDDISCEDFGFMTFEALASGRVPICGMERELLQQYPYYPAPILDCQIDTFVSKLESVLSEPRSLRDFNKRSWAYSNSLGATDKIKGELNRVLGG